MARPTKAAPTAKITFGEFVAEEAVNPWAEHVAALADRALTNPNASITIDVDVADAQGAQFKFQRAANDIGKTARLRLKDDSGVKVTGKDKDGDDIVSGNVALTFTLTGRHKGRGRTGSSAAAQEETPVETGEVSA